MSIEHDALAMPSAEKVPGGAPPQWVPILRLSTTHREPLRAHLHALSRDDRYLRFGFLASDEQIDRYVDGLDFERDELFGVVNRHLDIIACAHLALEAQPGSAADEAEFGISVSAHLRRNGVGKRLFEHAQMRARLRGIRILHIHALAENQAMQRLLRAAGASIERLGADTEAQLELPQAQTSTRVESWVEAGAAGLDYTAKQQVRRLSRMRAVLAKAVGVAGRSASDAE